MTFDTEPTVFCIHKAVPVLPLLIIEESAILTEPPLILTVAIVSDVAAAPKTCALFDMIKFASGPTSSAAPVVAS